MKPRTKNSNKKIYDYKLIKEFKEYDNKINWLAFVLITIVATGTWIEIFGVWAELPLMVNELPEGWRLPGILTGITQLGQIGSLSFIVMRHFFPKVATYKHMVYLKLIVTTIFTFLLSFIWHKQFFVLGESRSLGLYFTMFIFALFDGAAGISIIPYIGENFRKEYIIPYYIGETFYALFPSVIALSQGIKDHKEYKNVTISSYNASNASSLINDVSVDSMEWNNLSSSSNQTITQEYSTKTSFFSVSVYYIIMALFLINSLVSFILLNCLKFDKAELKDNTTPRKVYDYDDDNLDSISCDEVDHIKVALNEKSVKVRNEKIMMFTMNFLITFILYGTLPGLISYSTLPYGDHIFHMSINLTVFFSPVVIFVSIWSLKISKTRIVIEFLIASTFAAYIVFISALSPNPPFLHHWIGGVLSIICWIVTQSMYGRVRCIISTKLERFGSKTLMISGCFTLLGEVVGGILSYILIDVLRLFKEKSE